MKALARNVIDAMRSQPLALALLVINLMFLIGITAAVERKDELLAEIVKHCVK